MQTDAKQPGINKHAERLIKKTARRLVGKTGLTKSDVEDLEQELRLVLLKRLPSFDPTKSPFTAFVWFVIRRHANQILEFRSYRMRDWLRDGFSLNEKLSDGAGGKVERGGLMSRDVDDRRLGGRSERDRRDMVLDVEAMLARLPKKVRKLCELVKTMNAPDAAQRLMMPQATAYKWLRDLREQFREAGLEDYLGHPR